MEILEQNRETDHSLCAFELRVSPKARCSNSSRDPNRAANIPGLTGVLVQSIHAQAVLGVHGQRSMDIRVMQPLTNMEDQRNQPRGRVLIGKPGLDGHDRGAKYISRCLRDAGFEVIYTGIRRTPEEIASVAVQEDVDAIGLSLLSGSHNQLFIDVLEALKTAGAGDIPVLGGGVIPNEDVEGLKKQGIRAVFTPGTPMEEIVRAFSEAVEVRRRAG